MRRYLIADYGVPKGNVAVNYQVFLHVAVDLVSFLAQRSGGLSYDEMSMMEERSYHARSDAEQFVEVEGRGSFDTDQFAAFKNVRMFKSE